jgi:hypothetical protein
MGQSQESNPFRSATRNQLIIPSKKDPPQTPPPKHFHFPSKKQSSNPIHFIQKTEQKGATPQTNSNCKPHPQASAWYQKPKHPTNPSIKELLQTSPPEPRKFRSRVCRSRKPKRREEEETPIVRNPPHDRTGKVHLRPPQNAKNEVVVVQSITLYKLLI